MPIIDVRPTQSILTGVTPSVCRLLSTTLVYPDDSSPSGYRTVFHTNREGSGGWFLPGLTARVRGLIEGQKLAVEVVDNTGEVAHKRRKPTISLRDYQEEAVERCTRFKRGFLQAVVRAGKTRMAAAMMQVHRDIWPALFIVEKVELMHQSSEELGKMLGFEVAKVGQGRLEGPDDSPVVVAMVQTALNYFQTWHRRDDFHLIFVDEAHHASSPSYIRLLNMLRGTNRVYGLSGTPWRHDNKTLLLEAVIGPILHKVSYDDLINAVDPDTGEGYLCPPLVIFQRVPRAHTDAQDWQEQYRRAIINNAVRNRIIHDFCRWMLDHQKTVVVLVERIEHGEALSQMLDAPFVHGQSDGDYRERVLNRVRARQAPCVVTTLYREAVDIPSLNAVVNAGAGRSSIRFLQSMRNLTAYQGKKLAPVLDFTDRGNFVSRWSYDRKRMVKDQDSFIGVELGDYDNPRQAPAPDVWDWLAPALERGPAAIPAEVLQHRL